jgi:putative transposase
MTQALGAEKGERTTDRLEYRSGYSGRTLVTRIGKLELRVPQDRDGRFSTELFERYVQGVSTGKVKSITEELCGHSFSASSISAIKPATGHEPGAICRLSLGRSLPLSDPERAL